MVRVASQSLGRGSISPLGGDKLWCNRPASTLTLLCRVLGFHATFPGGPAFFFGPQRGARREGLVALSAWCRLCLKRPSFCSKWTLRAPRFCNPFLGEPAPSVEVTGPRSLTAWRPSTCTKRESSAHSAFSAHRQPTGARIRIVLVSKASGKPLRPRDLARSTT